MSTEPPTSPIKIVTENVSQSVTETASEERNTGRLEAFSDGVFAIAVTLLVLDIKVPPIGTLAEVKRTLWDALLDQWPVYAAYVISFSTILIMWINHHNLFKHIKRTDHLFLLLNGLLLMVVTVIPFPTALLAEYLRETNSYDPNVATIIYGSTNVLLAISFNLMWRYAIYNNRLLDPNADQEAVAAISRQYRYGPLIYLFTVLVATVSVWVSLILIAGLTIFFRATNFAQSLGEINVSA